MLTTKAPTTILVSSKTASSRLRKLGEQFWADAVDPVEYKCLRCHCEWDASPCIDYRLVTCSNCYSDRVVITIVRLGFEDWGPQNGGIKEQAARHGAAKEACSKALDAIGSLKTQGDDHER